MTIPTVVDLATQTLNLVMLLSGPLLATALTVGLGVSVVQAVTSIQEQTLSFVPKLFAVGGVFLVSLSWMIQQLLQFTHQLFVSIPTLAG
jgi:flagellar biosynthesis protein FliQ